LTPSSQQDAEEFARNLFGDPSAARMTLNQYLDSLKKVRPQTEENLKRAREFKDKVVDLNNALGELKNTAGRDLIPVFTRLAEQFTHFLEGEGGQRIANEIGKIAKALGDPENWTKAEEGIKGVGSGFVTIADAISKVSSVFGALPEPLRNALIGAAIGGRVAGPAGAVAGAVTGAGVGNDPLTNLQEHERAQTGATEKLKAFKKALEDFINGLGLAKQMSYMGGGGGAARIMQASLGGGGFGGARLMPASFSPSGAPFGTGGGTSPSFPFGGGRGQGSSPFGSGGGGGAGSSDAAQRIRGAAQSNGEGTMVGPNGETMTFYAPGAGGKMEGGFETSQPNKEGQNIPRTLDDLRSGNSDYVSVASDPSRYGQSVPLGTVTYRSPKDGKMYTLNNVNGYIHDTGSAFKGRPDKLDIASGDYRGWSGSAASAHVLGNSVVRPGGGMDAGGGPVAPGAVTAVGGGDPSAFIMHHTSGRGTVAGVQATLRQRGLGVQYVMDRDGNIVQTGGPGAAHMMSGSSKYGTNLAKRLGLSNKNVVGMEVIAKNDKDVTPAQIAAARDFIAKNYPNTPMFGHGEVNRHKETDEGMSIVNTIRNARAAGLGSPNLFSQRARSERLNRSLANSERALTARGRLDVSVKAPPGTSVKASGEGLFTNTHMERSVSRPNTPQGPTEPTSRGGDGGGEE
jgi:hypothetical protein